jgi:hypothetical protein
VIKDHETVDVFIGVDVGKTSHHAVALDRTGRKLLDKALPQDEAKLRAIIDNLAKHGTLLLVVDQPATIGALPVAVARAAGILVGYLPGLAMRRIADLHPGEAKTDARDAYIIAEAARSMPHTLRSIAVADEQAAELSMLCGFDFRPGQAGHRGLEPDPVSAHLRSTRPWSGSSALIWTTPRWPNCSGNTRPPRPCAGPGRPGSPRS